MYVGTILRVTMARVMACCLMASSHHLNQYWLPGRVKRVGYCACNMTLKWGHNEHDGVSNHQPHLCLLNRLFRRRSKKTSKLRATGLCEENSPVTGEFPAQRASNAENVSIDDDIMMCEPVLKIAACWLFCLLRAHFIYMGMKLWCLVSKAECIPVQSV